MNRMKMKQSIVTDKITTWCIRSHKCFKNLSLKTRNWKKARYWGKINKSSLFGMHISDPNKEIVYDSKISALG
jgi:hypothetical protein